MNPRFPALVILLTACAAPITPDARYTGPLTPTQPSVLCKPGNAVLRLRDGKALFIPEEATWSLTGTATADGAITAERVSQGANRQSYSTSFTGNWTPQSVTGAYTTPRCAYTLALTRN